MKSLVHHVNGLGFPKVWKFVVYSDRLRFRLVGLWIRL